MKRDFELSIDAPFSNYSLTIKQIFKAKARFVIFVDLIQNEDLASTGPTTVSARVSGVEVPDETAEFPNDFQVNTEQNAPWLIKQNDITPIDQEWYECQIPKTFVCIYDAQLVPRTIKQSIQLSVEVPSSGYCLEVTDVIKTKENTISAVVELRDDYRNVNPPSSGPTTVSVKMSGSIPNVTSRLPVAYYVDHHTANGHVPNWLAIQDHFEVADTKKLNQVRGAEGSVCLFDHYDNMQAMPEGGSEYNRVHLSPILAFGQRRLRTFTNEEENCAHARSASPF